MKSMHPSFAAPSRSAWQPAFATDGFDEMRPEPLLADLVMDLPDDAGDDWSLDDELAEDFDDA